MFRKLLGSALLVAFFSTLAGAVEPVKWHTDPAAAREAAKSSGLPILVFVTSSACPYCVKLKDETLSDANIIAHIEQHFVPLRVDRGTQPALEQKLRVTSYPTLVILDSTDAELHRQVGFLGAGPLSQSLRRIEVEWLAAHPRPGTSLK